YSMPAPLAPIYGATVDTLKQWTEDVNGIIATIEEVAINLETAALNLDSRQLSKVHLPLPEGEKMMKHFGIEPYIVDLEQRWEATSGFLDRLMQFFKMMLMDSDPMLKNLLAVYKRESRIEDPSETKARMGKVVESAKDIIRVAIGPEICNLIACGRQTFDCASELKRVAKELKKDIGWRSIDLARSTVISLPILASAYFRMVNGHCICSASKMIDECQHNH
ncbi:hypothetical protein PFISCL1PPCAC_5416, partial [Pristionchus fissidentatus]